MNTNALTKVALRHQALFLETVAAEKPLGADSAVAAFVHSLNEVGYGVSRELLDALCGVNAATLLDISRCINDVTGINLNWTPLVKGWDTPTGESIADHLKAWVYNAFGGSHGVKLPCGHVIPKGTFHMERYNGCPICGTPFQLADFVYRGQGSKLKELRLFGLADMERIYRSLLESPVPLDATQRDSLEILMQNLPFPSDVNIAMKETAMLAVHHLGDAVATTLLKTPGDILRYLWYEKTGQVQVVEPRTLIAKTARENAALMKQKLRLKYGRSDCRRVAMWLNALPMSAQQAAEQMNPKRAMWVRMIHALRLGEYSRREGFGHLAEILDVFYRHDYRTWQGRVDEAWKARDAQRALALLQERPGAFARCLFTAMMRFGIFETIAAFDAVADKLPARLLMSLGNAADVYFRGDNRAIRTISGSTCLIEPNKMLQYIDKSTRKTMACTVDDLYMASMQRRFAAQSTVARSIYIDPQLMDIPVAVGNRTATIQDASCALMGTRFPVQGDAVRLFLQWGKGLPAQHLDMDLSCRVVLPSQTEICFYNNLTATGAKHSGDIREIPDMVGTAEYIELSLPELEAAGALYVAFTCNAYSCANMSPNLVVGWMDSAYPMQISEQTGVAYDPSCVQHMVRISESNLSRGLLFGVLDVARREIIWLEMANNSQTVRGFNLNELRALLDRIKAKATIGQLLKMKAKAQGLVEVDSPEAADEAYTYAWALNPAEVSRLLFAI